MDIAKWDAGTWIALGAAVFALAAAVAAAWQAKAARDQVRIMRQQLSNETDDRHEAAGPVFSIWKSAEKDTAAGPTAEIMVVQEGGPRLSEVTVTTRLNEEVRGLIGEDGEKIVAAIIWKDNTPETSRQLMASLDPKGQEPVNVVLNFKSVEAETGATWHRALTTTPDLSFAARKFGRGRASPADKD